MESVRKVDADVGPRPWATTPERSDSMSQTHAEILNQPHAWEETLRLVPKQWSRIESQLGLGATTHALFAGCGTSLYIAQAAAQGFQEVTGLVASAVPASEIFLSPGTAIPTGQATVVFIISRSGRTSEALLAADFLRNVANVQTIGVTCNSGTELVRRTDHAIELPHATERSVVMTQSFTTMLLALQIVAGSIARDDALLAELHRLPGEARAQVHEADQFAQYLAGCDEPDLVVHLGLGPNQGLAEEGTLKLKEMTQVPCESYNPLEFRHGPISMVTDRTLIVILEGQRERAYIDDVERDLVGTGATVARIGPYAASTMLKSILVGTEFSDIARCCLYLPPLQLHGYYRALNLGLDPDRPRNLNQVVVLDAK